MPGIRGQSPNPEICGHRGDNNHRNHYIIGVISLQLRLGSDMELPPFGPGQQRHITLWSSPFAVIVEERARHGILDEPHCADVSRLRGEHVSAPRRTASPLECHSPWLRTCRKLTFDHCRII